MTYEEARRIYLESRLASSPYDAQLLAELGPAPSFWVSGQPPEPAPDKRGPNVLNFAEVAIPEAAPTGLGHFGGSGVGLSAAAGDCGGTTR